MHPHDGFHRVAIRELDIVEETTAQERVGQFFLVVAGDDHDRALGGLDAFPGFVNVEFHAIELGEQIVGELDIGLVDLVDQQHRQFFGREGFPHLAAADVVGNVGNARITQLAVAQAGNGIIFIQALLGLGGGFDVPFDQRRIEGVGDLLGQHRLAGAGFALHQQWPAQGDGGVDRNLQIIGGNVTGGAFETHAEIPFARKGYAGRRPDAILSNCKGKPQVSDKRRRPRRSGRR